MNALSRTVVLSLSILGLAACAGTQSKSTYVEPSMSNHQIAGMSRDDRYVSAVERLARKRGIEVMWVNPPDRRKLISEATPQ
ncbi:MULTISPECIES: hypothetical protein [Lysobacter]|jgi:hypothetical protein|uniref:Lipoprotein n=1 Tax=Lysobacter gummosus TaxID=262324 RepID=A0ABY3XHB3_9GAMM|nr:MULTISPECIES: hypothetical protein [Lysobacter]ALN90488.1 hypothetical protein LG3211_1512 [Lysobacter gummosus]MBT2746975.1 hypothetical protein [Lysobacter sp. ISL-42]MBT2750563.1 hypothetical protein [Lysobacter sp. ISL-50]MBT2776410.1 hypothetical protein [Lysobacter sp. ISL-54]MBT2780904.1 hypothetical protein [Lysobacter sp. ISL-52]